MRRLSYDERQILAPLRICQTCGKPFYMWGLICGLCGPGFRTMQRHPPSKLDCQGNLIDGP